MKRPDHQVFLRLCLELTNILERPFRMEERNPAPSIDIFGIDSGIGLWVFTRLRILPPGTKEDLIGEMGIKRSVDRGNFVGIGIEPGE
jgi:hypothetical protein